MNGWKISCYAEKYETLTSRLQVIRCINFSPNGGGAYWWSTNGKTRERLYMVAKQSPAMIAVPMQRHMMSPEGIQTTRIFLLRGLTLYSLAYAIKEMGFKGCCKQRRTSKKCMTFLSIPWRVANKSRWWSYKERTWNTPLWYVNSFITESMVLIGNGSCRKRKALIHCIEILWYHAGA